MNPDTEETGEPAGKSKWYKRMAIIFAFLFAIFWSLGPFFFWVLSSLAAYFGFLAIYNSETKFTFFNRQSHENPYRSYQSTQGPGRPAGNIVRNVLLVFGGIFLFFFIIGIFSKNEEDSTSVTATESDSQSADVSSPEANAYNEKGNTLYSQGLYDSALLYYNRALTISPDDQYALYNKALVYFIKKDFRKSISLVRKCLRDHPDYNEGLWLLGDDYAELNNYDSAIYCLEKARNNNFDDPNFLQLMAEVFSKKGNSAKALEYYKMVVERDTTNAEAFRQLAILDPANADIYRRKASNLQSR